MKVFSRSISQSGLAWGNGPISWVRSSGSLREACTLSPNPVLGCAAMTHLMCSMWLVDQEFCLTVVLAQALTHSHIHYPGALIRKGYVIVSYFIASNVTKNTQQTSGLFLINVGYWKQFKIFLLCYRGQS